jgi:hypothetical protein
MPEIQATIAGVYSTHGIRGCDRNHRTLSQQSTRMEKAFKAVFSITKGTKVHEGDIESFVSFVV